MGVVTYIKETKAEMSHVTWPTRTDVALFTATVILVSVLTALYLGVFDFLFSRGLELVLPGQTSPATPQDDLIPPSSTDETTPPPAPADETPSFDPEAILRGEAQVNP